jgi:rhodanese-related sulfurtransferase
MGLHQAVVTADRSVESLLADARAGLQRLTPEQAFAAAQDGAVLVDTRSADEQREQRGVIPGAVHHPLSVVLWRLDEVPRDARVILICRHGQSSSLAAARLQELGFRDATDVEGGFEAWAAAGLPVDAVGPDR